MNPTLRNILAVLAGILAGSALNSGIIAVSASIIPPPDGADLKTMEGLKAAMHLMQPKHFVLPFLAHTLGTLLGAFVAAKIAVNNPMRLAMVVAGLFLVGGIMNVMMLPSPLWFSMLDLVVAYLPMGLLGAKLAGGKRVGQ